ncbi:WD40 repeat-containing protein [Planoprotostelium fungivorum]|uniref:Peroxin-7 n=1 Tax=Planoprotostelium fungivorum TaxID=1890364 RepID=A0A2P6NLH8_9EUKA|nr:WD40 repeat-containing protein [Planoprotostelium fungivorum]
MGIFKTNFGGFATRFSPFDENRIAVATSQHYGIVGNGKLHILEIVEGGRMLREITSFMSKDGLYDLAWSEDNENVIVGVSGDGSIKIWDMSRGGPDGRFPVRSYQEHGGEVHSIDWNPINRRTFITGSWDESIKLWDPMAMQGSVQTFKEHRYCVYSTVWSPYHESRFASASGDRTVKIWDTKAPMASNTILAHDHEILSCDWNKYNENILVSASVDKTIKIWDIRSTQRELGVLKGHGYAWVQFTREADVDSDMTVCLWDTLMENALVRRFDHHTEFVVGVDFSLFIPGQMASCAWDETVQIWNI